MSKKVLVIDDSATMRQMIKMTLDRAGYEVGEAEDGEKGLRKASMHVFDLVLSDVNMPVMNGFELIRKLRVIPDYKFTPIILITTESNAEKKQEGKAAGATGWIVKPFDQQQLIAVVAKVLR